MTAWDDDYQQRLTYVRNEVQRREHEEWRNTWIGILSAIGGMFLLYVSVVAIWYWRVTR